MCRELLVVSDADKYALATGVTGDGMDEAIGSKVGDGDGAGFAEGERDVSRLFRNTQPEHKVMAIKIAQITKAIAELRMGILWGADPHQG